MENTWENRFENRFRLKDMALEGRGVGHGLDAEIRAFFRSEITHAKVEALEDLIPEIEARKLSHEPKHEVYEGCYECEHNQRIDEDIAIIRARIIQQKTVSAQTQ